MQDPCTGGLGRAALELFPPRAHVLPGFDLKPLQAYALTYANSNGGEKNMFAERHVRLFRNGRNQTVRIPVNSELDARRHHAKEDDRLVIEPVRKQGLLATLAALAPLAEDWRMTWMPACKRWTTSNYERAALLAGHQRPSDLVRHPQGIVARKIAAVGEAAVCTSIIVAAELRFGARQARLRRLSHQVHAILSAIEVLPLDMPADTPAQLRALEQSGRPSAPTTSDRRQAWPYECVLVTANLGELFLNHRSAGHRLADCPRRSRLPTPVRRPQTG